MCKVSMQLCRKEKIGPFGSSFQPPFCSLLKWRPVKSTVNFNTINKSAYIFKLVNFWLGINNPLPIRIRPTCYSYINLIQQSYSLTSPLSSSDISEKSDNLLELVNNQQPIINSTTQSKIQRSTLNYPTSANSSHRVVYLFERLLNFVRHG